MTLKDERVTSALVLVVLVLSLSVSLWWGLSPKSGTAPAPKLSTQTIPSSGNASPEASPRVLATPSVEARPPASETVRWTDESIVRLMLIGIVLQAIGFLFVFWQVRQLKRGIQGETHSRLYEHYQRTTERLAGEMKLRPYFYDPEKELEEDTPGYADMHERIEMMCEVILGLLEHAAVQQKNLPKDSWTACWEAYTNERLDKSIELRKFFRDNHKWYAKSFCNVVAAKYPHLVKKCDCTVKVAAKQADCPPASAMAPDAGAPSS